MSKNLSGEEDEFEFLLRRSTAASLQNSTHLGVLELSRDFREKFEEYDDDDEEEDDEDPLIDRCFCRQVLLVVKDSRSKKSDKSSPQQKM